MNDLISRKALLAEYDRVHIGEPGKARKLFEDAPVAKDINVPSKWIPVTERLPELIPCNAGTAYSEAVIVWTDNRKAMIAVWDGIDFLCAASYWEAEGEEITHWMPLPEPPEGAIENDI